MFDQHLQQLDLLRRVDIRRTLDDVHLRRVSGLLREQRFAANKPLFDQGDSGDCLYIIISGFVRIYLLNMDGREVTVRIYGAGSAIGEFTVLDGKPRSACAVAMEEVTTLVIYREDFLSLLEFNFELVRRVIEALTERLRFTTTFSQNLAFLSASGRIAAELAQRAARVAKTSEPVRLALTQQDLANHASVTREWTNKALRDFAAQGLLRIERGAVIVLDQERLSRWSEA